MTRSTQRYYGNDGFKLLSTPVSYLHDTNTVWLCEMFRPSLVTVVSYIHKSFVLQTLPDNRLLVPCATQDQSQDVYRTGGSKKTVRSKSFLNLEN